MDKFLGNLTVVRIIALILALLLWVVVHLDQQVVQVPTTSAIQTRSISDVEIAISGLNTDQLHLQSIDPLNVNIVLRGRESAINQVSNHDGQVHADLSNITEGVHVIRLEAVGYSQGAE